MAGDWIKVEKSTARKPEVLAISSALEIHPDHAFGLCVRFWAWCDDQLENGHAASVTNVTLDFVIGHSGFAQQLILVGWLKETDSGIDIPNFDYHLSESAKTRAQAAKRKSKSRTKRDICHDNNVTKTRPEKRREEKSNESDVVIPGKLNTEQAIRSAETWFDYLLSKGWDDKVPPKGSPQEEAFWLSSARTFQTDDEFSDAVQYTMANGWRTLTGRKEQKTKTKGHTESADWILTQQACRKFPNDFQKRLDMIGQECRDALKAAGGASQFNSLTHELDIKAMGARFEFHLDNIRKAMNGTAKSN